MRVEPVVTSLVKPNDDLFALIDKYVPVIPEKTVLVVTSKIVSLCEGSVVKKDGTKEQKEKLVAQEAEWYLPPHSSKYQLMLTIVHSTLLCWAGIDESNVGQEWYVLAPKDPYKSAEIIWRYLRETRNLKELGVIITDSKIFPLKWGEVGTCLAHCGLSALVDYRDTLDLFGRPLVVTQVNVAEGVAAAAVLCMGEAAEAQPLCLVSDVPHTTFSSEPPTAKEKQFLMVEKEDDAYAPLLTAVEWRKGGRS